MNHTKFLQLNIQIIPGTFFKKGKLVHFSFICIVFWAVIIRLLVNKLFFQWIPLRFARTYCHVNVLGFHCFGWLCVWLRLTLKICEDDSTHCRRKCNQMQKPSKHTLSHFKSLATLATIIIMPSLHFRYPMRMLSQNPITIEIHTQYA